MSVKTSEWVDYEIIATGSGYKLERWGDVYLMRPDPQVIWPASMDMAAYPKLNAKYNAEAGKQEDKWTFYRKLPADFAVKWRGLVFNLKLMNSFKHTGLFPEQAANWAKMMQLISAEKREIKVLNLFAYTGGATLACASAGAKVCHVDAAPAMVARAKQNIEASGLSDKPVRYIVDDCLKFVNREIKRGNRYDAIIMDPPSFGRGPNGELWKLEDSLFPLVAQAAQLMSDNPLFFLINSYTTGLQPTVIKNILELTLSGRKNLQVEGYELVMQTNEGITLPGGCSGMATFNGRQNN